MDHSIKYVIITPVRNEMKYIDKTFKSVVAQTVKPLQWVIVDDGSSDGSGNLIDYYAKEINWITAVHIPDRGFRQAGQGVIEAFYCGYKKLIHDEWDFIVKLDADLEFEIDYFEKCFKKFKENSKLWIGGGDIYVWVQGKLVREQNPIFHVRGATKIYSKNCWKGINGIIKAPGWDTIDEVKANQLGKDTKTFTDIKIIQLKRTGSAYSVWAEAKKNGRADYVCCYHPIFELAKCLKFVKQRPFMVTSIGRMWGFITGYLSRNKRVEDAEFKKYIRMQQLKKMFALPTIWK